MSTVYFPALLRRVVGLVLITCVPHRRLLVRRRRFVMRDAFRLGVILLLLLSDGVEVVLSLLLSHRGPLRRRGVLRIIIRGKVVDGIVGKLCLRARLRGSGS